MGVKTIITLDALNRVFPSYNFIHIQATSSGVMDTTYIISTKENSYILKKYERDIFNIIYTNMQLLNELKSFGLNVSICIDESNELYIYEKLQGEQPKNIKIHHIQALARFMAKMHTYTYRKCSNSNFLNKDEIEVFLSYTKSNFYFYYKKLELLRTNISKCDGIIHGDIFKDNTVFDGRKIGVFDFIESNSGSFVFDVSVALFGFNVKKNNLFFINIFLNTYNQNSPKKISKKELLLSMEIAKIFYSLFGIYIHKNTKRAKIVLSAI